MICGIDEAGKGAVFGSMTIALACSIYSREETNSILNKLKVRDSKLLSRSKRRKIISEITKDSGFFVFKIITSTEIIDKYVCNNRLNQLLYQSYLSLIKESMSVFNSEASSYYIDAFSSPISLKRMLLEDIRRNSTEEILPELIVEHKADTNYPIVALASIFAKEAREDSVDLTGLREFVGSGYPSDERVKDYIRSNKDEYDKKTLKLIRYSWKIKL